MEQGTITTKTPSACTLFFDIEGILKSARPIVNQGGKERATSYDRLRIILSMLLTPGLHESIDGICRDRLRIPSSCTSVGITRFVLVLPVYRFLSSNRE